MPGHITKLTIRIPKSQDHPFWKRSSRDLSDWEFDNEELSFQVERWGLSKTESLHYAMQRARDIVACIRKTLSEQIQLDSLLGVPLISPLIIPQYPMLRLGHELKDFWKRYPPSSSRLSNTLYALLETKINSDSRIQVQLLLRYYQVYSQLYLY
jgi:hypothetical protein